MLGLLGWRRLRGRKVLVNLKSGGAIRGVLTSRRGVYMFIDGGEFITEADAGNPQKIPGQTVVERPNVAYYQVLK